MSHELLCRELLCRESRYRLLLTVVVLLVGTSLSQAQVEGNKAEGMVETPAAEPEKTERDLYNELRALFSTKKFDEAAELIEKGLEQYPDSAILSSQRYTLYRYLAMNDRAAEGLPHFEKYVDEMLARPVTTAAMTTNVGNFVGRLLDAYLAAEQSDKATAKVEAFLAAAGEKEDPEALVGTLNGQKAILLAKLDKVDEGKKLLEEQIAMAKKALDETPDDVGAISLVVARLKDAVALETAIDSEEIGARSDELLAFLKEKATAHADQREIVSQYLQELYAKASAISRSEPEESEKLAQSIEDFLTTHFEGEEKAQEKEALSRRFNLEMLRRRIEAAKKLLALIGTEALLPENAAGWANGEELSADDLKGKVLVIDFWAMWCGPCIATFPHLREWREEYAEQGFEVLGITRFYKYDWDDEAERITRVEDLEPEQELAALERFAEHHELEHPMVVMEETNVHEHYGVTGIPQAVVIDRQGKIRLIRVGSGEQNAHDLQEMIETCLAEKPSNE